MSKRVLELRQEYNQTVKQMRDLHEAAEKDSRGFTTDEQAKYDTSRTGLDGQETERAATVAGAAPDGGNGAGFHSRSS